jgi:hypothetical protein
VVLIEGEPGIGKTRLLDEALANARGRGMQVAAGWAVEPGADAAVRPGGQRVRCAPSSPDARRVAIAEPAGGRGGGERGPITVTSDPGLRFRAVDAFADLAEEAALSGPLVIGADDLQWADPSSLLTGALVRRLAYLPVALVGACGRPRGPETGPAGLRAGSAGAHLIARPRQRCRDRSGDRGRCGRARRGPLAGISGAGATRCS